MIPARRAIYSGRNDRTGSGIMPLQHLRVGKVAGRSADIQPHRRASDIVIFRRTHRPFAGQAIECISTININT